MPLPGGPQAGADALSGAWRKAPGGDAVDDWKCVVGWLLPTPNGFDVPPVANGFAGLLPLLALENDGPLPLPLPLVVGGGCEEDAPPNGLRSALPLPPNLLVATGCCCCCCCCWNGFVALWCVWNGLPPAPPPPPSPKKLIPMVFTGINLHDLELGVAE
jgi:hypothetical protein